MLASKQHDKHAEKQRVELAPRLSPDNVTKSELSAAEWKPLQVQNPAAVTKTFHRPGFCRHT
jgi:hypothetical protein